MLNFTPCSPYSQGHKSAPDDMLDEHHDLLQQAGIELVFAVMKDPVKDKLKRFQVFKKLGEINFYPTVGAAVEAYVRNNQVDWIDWEDVQSTDTPGIT